MQLCRNAELLESWSVQWNFTVSVLVQILLSLSADVHWFQQRQELHSACVDVDLGVDAAAQLNLI